MIIWALFDSGNGSYYKVAKEMNGVEIYPIGIDRENKNEHFINLDLADYSRLFGNNKMFETLDKLPNPDLIIASPPCESWSVASAMKNGNACWKQDKLENLFGTMEGSKLHWISSKGTFYNKYIATNKIEEGYMVLARYSDVITKGNITYINRVKIKEY